MLFRSSLPSFLDRVQPSLGGDFDELLAELAFERGAHGDEGRYGGEEGDERFGAGVEELLRVGKAGCRLAPVDGGGGGANLAP